MATLRGPASPKGAHMVTLTWPGPMGTVDTAEVDDERQSHTAAPTSINIG